MDNISYKLNIFEGPLDLLLHLISKHKLNINDIEISVLVEQYLAYLENVESTIEISGEFLEMAATLIYIKTVSLLPKQEEAVSLKKELEGKLIEYSLCKKAAELLTTRYVGNLVTVRKPLKIDFDMSYNNIHSAEILANSYSSIKIKDEKKINKETKKPFEEIVTKKIYSVTAKIIHVLKLLYKNGEFFMDNLFCDVTEKSERVAIFLALLELTKAGRISFNDDNSKITFNTRAN